MQEKIRFFKEKDPSTIVVEAAVADARKAEKQALQVRSRLQSILYCQSHFVLIVATGFVVTRIGRLGWRYS